MRIYKRNSSQTNCLVIKQAGELAVDNCAYSERKNSFRLSKFERKSSALIHYMNSRYTNSLVALIILSIALLLLFVLPQHVLFSGSPVCIHYRWFGIRCPFCGMLRSVWSFLHGNFNESIRFNFNVIFLPVIYLLLLGFTITGNNRVYRALLITVWSMVAGLLGIYVYRIMVG
jgi:hypothetical protein